jgi:hypothetical protein
MAEIERFVRYSTRVRELPEAWSFVMTHIDHVGGAPGVEISPTWGHYDGIPEEGSYIEPADPPLWFEVSVSGSTKDNGDG